MERIQLTERLDEFSFFFNNVARYAVWPWWRCVISKCLSSYICFCVLYDFRMLNQWRGSSTTERTITLTVWSNSTRRNSQARQTLKTHLSRRASGSVESGCKYCCEWEHTRERLNFTWSLWFDTFYIKEKKRLIIM